MGNRLGAEGLILQFRSNVSDKFYGVFGTIALDYVPPKPRDKLESLSRGQELEPPRAFRPEPKKGDSFLTELDEIDRELKGLTKFPGYSKPVKPYEVGRLLSPA